MLRQSPSSMVQVAHYVRNFDHNLTSQESNLLFILASYDGGNGIYPSVSTLAKNNNCSNHKIFRILACLKKRGLVKTLGVRGKSNHYTLHIPCTDNKVIHTHSNIATSSTDDTPHPSQHCDTTHRNSATTPIAPLLHKVVKEKKKEVVGELCDKERMGSPRGRPTLLLSDYMPSKETIEFVLGLGMSRAECNKAEKAFFDHYKGSGEWSDDWQAKNREWMAEWAEKLRGNVPHATPIAPVPVGMTPTSQRLAALLGGGLGNVRVYHEPLR